MTHAFRHLFVLKIMRKNFHPLQNCHILQLGALYLRSRLRILNAHCFSHSQSFAEFHLRSWLNRRAAAAQRLLSAGVLHTGPFHFLAKTYATR